MLNRRIMSHFFGTGVSRGKTFLQPTNTYKPSFLSHVFLHGELILPTKTRRKNAPTKTSPKPKPKQKNHAGAMPAPSRPPGNGCHPWFLGSWQGYSRVGCLFGSQRYPFAPGFSALQKDGSVSNFWYLKNHEKTAACFLLFHLPIFCDAGTSGDGDTDLDPISQDDKIQLTDFLSATLKPSHVKSEKVLEEGCAGQVDSLEWWDWVRFFSRIMKWNRFAQHFVCMYMPVVGYSKKSSWKIWRISSEISMISCPCFFGLWCIQKASPHGFYSLTVNRPRKSRFLHPSPQPAPEKKPARSCKRFTPKTDPDFFWGSPNSIHETADESTAGTLQLLWLPWYRVDFARRLKTSLGTRVPWAETTVFLGHKSWVPGEFWWEKRGEAQHVFWKKATRRLSTTRRA